VILNWINAPIEDFSLYAEAYHKVAKAAFDEMKKIQDVGFHRVPIDDFLTFPIVYLYRHSLELNLKAVILTGAPMLELKGNTKINTGDILKTHSLEKLAEKIEQIFSAYGWEWDLGTEHFTTLQDFRDIIIELHNMDTKATAFRYPLNNKGDASLPKNFEFNIYDFCEIIDGLLYALEGAAYGAHEELQQTYEMIAEFYHDI